MHSNPTGHLESIPRREYHLPTPLVPHSAQNDQSAVPVFAGEPISEMPPTPCSRAYPCGHFLDNSQDELSTESRVEVDLALLQKDLERDRSHYDVEESTTTAARRSPHLGIVWDG